VRLNIQICLTCLYQAIRLCHPPDGSTSPSISCCVLNHHNLFYQIQNAPAFNQDTCCHLGLCLRLLPFHYLPCPRFYNRLQMLAIDKRPSLFHKSVNRTKSFRRMIGEEQKKKLNSIFSPFRNLRMG
jgi:hypothetical protein